MSTSMSPISANIVNLLANTAATTSDSGKLSDVSSFSNILEEAFATAGITDQADKVSTLELLAGEADSLSALMIDSQKAELSLNLALQLRNKVMDAYQEIMSMQV